MSAKDFPSIGDNQDEEAMEVELNPNAIRTAETTHSPLHAAIESDTVHYILNFLLHLIFYYCLQPFQPI